MYPESAGTQFPQWSRPDGLWIHAGGIVVEQEHQPARFTDDLQTDVVASLSTVAVLDDVGHGLAEGQDDFRCAIGLQSLRVDQLCDLVADPNQSTFKFENGLEAAGIEL